MNPSEMNRISIVEARQTPRMLRIIRSDGTTLDVLHGVKKEELEDIAKQLTELLSPP